MKLLHTSDWHLGQTFFNYDRLDEHCHFFRQLADIVARERPDIMVVSGDVFHVVMPSSPSLRLFTDGLLSVCAAAPDMDVFVTAGNHDSAMRLEADSALWRHHRVRVVGGVGADAAHMVFRVEGKAIVAAVPYFSPRFADPGVLFGSVGEEVRRLDDGCLPIVYMAHAAVAGADVSGHDDGVGGMDFIPLAVLGGLFDYLALGHIHCPQELRGSQGRARYCGTPVATSFDEAYPHGVDIVDVWRGALPMVRTVKIEPLRPMLTLPKEPVPFDQAADVLAALPDDADCYVRLNVLVDDFLPSDALRRASDVAKGKKCRLCQVRPTRLGMDKGEAICEGRLQMSEFRALDPIEVAKMAYEAKFGKAMDDPMVSMLKEVVDGIRQKES